MLHRERGLSLLNNRRMQCSVEDVLSGSAAKVVWLFTNVKGKTQVSSNHVM